MRCASPRQDGSTPCWCLRALQSMDRLWLLGITLVLTMASGERLLEPGVRLKTAKPKSQAQLDAISRPRTKSEGRKSVTPPNDPLTRANATIL